MVRWAGGGGAWVMLCLMAGAAAQSNEGEEGTCSGATLKQVLSTLAGLMSMCGSAFIVHQFHQRYDLRTLLDIGGREASAGPQTKHADIATKLVAWLSATDFLSSFSFCLGRAPVTKSVEYETRASFFCTMQGFMIQFLGLSTITLTTAIAVNLFLLVVKGKTLTTLRKYEKNYLLASYGPPAVLACLLLIPNSRSLNIPNWPEDQPELSATRTSYGPAGTWCWVEEKSVGLIVFYLPLVACWLTTLYIVFYAVPSELDARAGKGRSVSQRSLQAVEASAEGIKTLRSYGICFFFIWFWGLLNRIIGLFSGQCGSPLVFQLLHAIFIPFQGFLNACVYTGFHIKVLNYFGIWLEDADGDVDADGTRASGLILSAQDGPGGSALGTSRLERKLSIFVGTWNMGEADIDENDDALAKWIEDGHDLYCVGVQECLIVDDVEAAVGRVLASRCDEKEEWQSWKHSIGSEHTEVGFHGFIAIVVFVRKTEVDSGNFEPTGRATGTKGGQLATGKNVGGKKMANKGAVGCSFRWFDTTLAFANAHLASDAGDGTSKVEKRNSDAYAILRHLKIDMEDVEFDWPLLHHQAFFLGDLNYRIEMQPDEAVEETVSAVQAKDWSRLHGADELMTEMRSGRVFSGFEEANNGPDFPPTYRRVRGASPGDYSDVEHVKSCYTLSVSRGKEGETAPRTPSWCDRVLLHSNDGQQGKIRCKSYHLCDALLPSDHVPVSATYELSVDADHPVFSTRDGLTQVPQVRATMLFSELVMESSTSGFKPSTYTTVLPLPAEDPDGQNAKVAELGGALTGYTATSSQGLVDRVQSIRMTSEDDGSRTHRVSVQLPQEARLAAKMHMGIKAVDANQSSIAQGVLPLADVIIASVGTGDAEAATTRFEIPMSLGGVPVAHLRGLVCMTFEGAESMGSEGGASPSSLPPLPPLPADGAVTEHRSAPNQP